MEELDKCISFWSGINNFAGIIAILAAILLVIVNFQFKNNPKSKTWLNALLILGLIIAGEQALSFYASNQIEKYNTKLASIKRKEEAFQAKKALFPIGEFSLYIKYKIEYKGDKSILKHLKGYNSPLENKTNKKQIKKAKEYFIKNLSNQFLDIGFTDKDTATHFKDFDFTLQGYLDLKEDYFLTGTENENSSGQEYIYSDSIIIDRREISLNVSKPKPQITSLLDFENKNVFVQFGVGSHERSTNCKITIDEILIKNGSRDLIRLHDFEQTNKKSSFLRVSNKTPLILKDSL